MYRYGCLWVIALLFISCQESFDERLSKEVSTYTQKHCPKNEDAFTRLDSITYQADNRTIHFWYMLHGDGCSLENKLLLKANYAQIHHELIRRLRGDVQWNDCKEEGINFRYNYFLEDTQQAFLTFDIVPNDYR